MEHITNATKRLNAEAAQAKFEANLRKSKIEVSNTKIVSDIINWFLKVVMVLTVVKIVVMVCSSIIGSLT